MKQPIDNTYPGFPRDEKGNVIVKVWMPRQRQRVGTRILKWVVRLFT